MESREYRHDDERGWLRCRVLSFLDTAYFDSVLQTKEDTVCSKGTDSTAPLLHFTFKNHYNQLVYGVIIIECLSALLNCTLLAQEHRLSFHEKLVE